MKWTSLNELREKYLSFFEGKGHLRLPSFPLVPRGDKSLLLINSGMAPMKKFFTGELTPPSRRVVTCQKCIRTPDLERVGHTARHGTFFEMLGNFSFGDYFKEQALPWAWEFLTECLEIPEDRLFPSIYEEDEEAFRIWTEDIGVPSERITRLGKADNFWEHGQGPCGPCSEIYFDRGLAYGCGSPDCRPGCDCDRFMEIWNNVFSQFNNDGAGHYTELEQKNIDTGMGLERLACVMQGVDSMFAVDSIKKLLDAVAAVAGTTYGKDKKTDISLRVVTDHVRSAMFMISDGVLPSNEGRGYVLRRILRRAVRHGKLLGIEGHFLAPLATLAIEESEGAYPNLRERCDFILRVIETEEERFFSTLDAGLSLLRAAVEKTKAAGETVLSGDDAFRLYDTYGFPIDLTRELAEESGLSLDEEGYKTALDAQRKRARDARGATEGWKSEEDETAGLEKTLFLGYTEESCDGSVVALIKDGERVESAEGVFSAVFDRTVLYGEGGGQVGDTGTATVRGMTARIVNTKKTEGVYFHEIESEVSLAVGDRVTLLYDKARRERIRRNHSATHLLQAALREVLGAHVEQAGSYVDDRELRFDFSHIAAMTEDELLRVEAIVNGYILEAAGASTRECSLEEAKAEGAMALFGEKYGDTVRLVKIGSHSTELCGGTHVKNSGEIGLFRILSESSVAAGIRRITALTGYGVLSLLDEREATLSSLTSLLKCPTFEGLEAKVSGLQSDLKEKTRALEAASAKLAEGEAQALLDKIEIVNGKKLLFAVLERPTAEVKQMAAALKEKVPDTAVLLVSHTKDSLTFSAVCGKEAVAAGLNAGKLVSAAAAATGGRGGGRPEEAAAGGKDPSALGAAREAVLALL